MQLIERRSIRFITAIVKKNPRPFFMWFIEHGLKLIIRSVVILLSLNNYCLFRLRTSAALLIPFHVIDQIILSAIYNIRNITI